MNEVIQYLLLSARGSVEKDTVKDYEVDSMPDSGSRSERRRLSVGATEASPDLQNSKLTIRFT